MTAQSRQLHIFISYRRDDSSHAAGRLHDRLSQSFPDQVFMDIDDIELGVDFQKKVEEAIATSDVVIALIGRNWIDATDAAGKRRIENPNDFVRLELAAALRGNIPIIPALADGAKMPVDSQLPPELRPLLLRHGLQIGHTTFDADVTTLLEGLEGISAKKPLPRKNRRYLVIAAIAALILAGGAFVLLQPKASDPPAAAKSIETQSVAAMVAGTYTGDVISDSQGGSRSNIVVTVVELGPNSVSVTSPYARIGSIEIELQHIGNQVIAASGDTPFIVNLDSKPATLSLNPRNELAYQGVRSLAGGQADSH